MFLAIHMQNWQTVIVIGYQACSVFHVLLLTVEVELKPLILLADKSIRI